MTKLLPDELISLQVVVSPIVSGIHGYAIYEMNNLKYKIYKGQPLRSALQRNIFEDFLSLPGMSIPGLLLKGAWKLIVFAGEVIISMFLAFVDSRGKDVPTREISNPYEKELATINKEKINQPLFKKSIRPPEFSSHSRKLQTSLSELMLPSGPMSIH